MEKEAKVLEKVEPNVIAKSFETTSVSPPLNPPSLSRYIILSEDLIVIVDVIVSVV